MRLSTEQTRQITRTVSQLTGGSADVYVFGSRLDDTARGGDIDLLLESAAPLGLIQRARIKMELEAQLGLPAIPRTSPQHAIAGKPAPTGQPSVTRTPASGAVNVGAGLPAILRTSLRRAIAGKPAPTGRFNHPRNKHE
jgi:predicted nucleotidyltransferase